jgi:hypothetical protein
MSKKNDIEYSEMKYKQLLRDYSKLLKDNLVVVKSHKNLEKLIIDLAGHMNLKDVGKMSPIEIINSAKNRITKIHLIY